VQITDVAPVVADDTGGLGAPRGEIRWPASEDLVGWAEVYRELGYVIIPVIGKKPPRKLRWSQPISPAAVDRYLSDERTTGLAVVLGPRSGGLLARDFDDMAAYLAWSDIEPELAADLPTSRTSRGAHVFFKGVSGVRRFSDGVIDDNYFSRPATIRIPGP
jgi:hypothetical protein